MSWFKPKKEYLKQLVNDTIYAEVCPVCQWYVEERIHLCDNFPTKKITMECSQCHNALYGRKIKYTETLQTYVKDEDGIAGLRLIEEKVVKTQEWK